MNDFMQLVQSATLLRILLATVWGVCLGSLINVVVYRLPRMLLAGRSRFNLFLPTSHCPHCKTPICWWDNIPLLSWLCLAGRCRHCSVAISRRYPLVETGFMVNALLLAYWIPTSELLVAAMLLSGFLLTLSLIDIDCKLLPDSLTLPLLWAGLLFHLLMPDSQVTLQMAVIGAVAGYIVLWLLYWLFYFSTRREGLGYGDFKLLAALGGWLGWQNLPLLLLLAAVTGIVAVLLGRHWSGRSLEEPFAFGPCLALAGWVLFLWLYCPKPLFSI